MAMPREKKKLHFKSASPDGSIQFEIIGLYKSLDDILNPTVVSTIVVEKFITHLNKLETLLTKKENGQQLFRDMLTLSNSVGRSAAAMAMVGQHFPPLMHAICENLIKGVRVE